MSRRNHRAAAAILIGVLAGSLPVGATTASAKSGASDPSAAIPPSTDPPEPGAAGGGNAPLGDPAPGTPVSPPATGAPAGSAQCGQVIFTNTLPTVITCGPVTITFNTVTTTTTVTTVSAPITAANGPITSTVTTPAPATPVRCTRPRSTKTVRPKRRTTSPKHKSGALVLRPAKGTRTVRFRVLFGVRPSF